MLSTAVLIPGLDPTTLIIEPSCDVPCSNCPVEPPWLSYIDLSSVGDTGYVDDSALFEARWKIEQSYNYTTGTIIDTSHYEVAKVVNRLERPAGAVFGGGELLWMEQDLGVVRKCQVSSQTGQCTGETSIVLDGLHCPEDFAVDFHRGRIYVIQNEGRSANDAPERCYGSPRISRAALSRGADGDKGQVDVVSSGMGRPTALALDPIGGPDGAGYLFWTDRELYKVMRASLDGTEQMEIVHDASPSGLAVDPSRASLYYTSAERGAGLTWTNYEGRHPPPKAVIPEALRVFFEPVALALNVADGSVYVVQRDTYVDGCDPTAGAGQGAITCAEREQGRITRVSCAWGAHLTTDGFPAAPHECCCHEPSVYHSPCKLVCAPPAPSPPPPEPPGYPPIEGGPETMSPPPVAAAPPQGDFSKMVLTDETVLEVGGLLVEGMQATLWGDPTHMALLPAVRLLPANPGGPRDLSFGNCSAGCGRPSGSDGCRRCLPGSYGSGEGVCRLCPAGKRGNASEAGAALESVACQKCEGGTFASAFGSSACQVCPIGHICTDAFELAADLTLQPIPPVGAIPLPTACPRGTYNPAEGAATPAACLLCATGRYRNASGGVHPLDSCDACVPGFFAGTAGAHYCDPCAPSTFQPSAAAGSCQQCAAGYFQDAYNATACEGCAEGTYGVADGAGSRCVDCPEGTYGAVTAATGCTPCPVNTLGAVAGAASEEAGCAPCPDFTFNMAVGSTSCDPCPTEIAINQTTGEEIPPPEGCELTDSPAPPSPRAGWLPVLVALAAGVLCAAGTQRTL